MPTLPHPSGVIPSLSDILTLRVARGTTRFVGVADIATIHAAENYSIVELVNGRRLRVRRPISHWETLLPAADFVRVHRQHIVNLGQLRAIERLTDDTSMLDVAGAAAPVRASYRYLPTLRARLTAREHLRSTPALPFPVSDEARHAS